jgi:hypothetical protein
LIGEKAPSTPEDNQAAMVARCEMENNQACFATVEEVARLGYLFQKPLLLETRITVTRINFVDI